MALKDLFGWKSSEEKPSACGTACGAADKPGSDGTAEETPAACGTACGAADKEEKAGKSPLPAGLRAVPGTNNSVRNNPGGSDSAGDLSDSEQGTT